MTSCICLGPGWSGRLRRQFRWRHAEKEMPACSQLDSGALCAELRARCIRAIEPIGDRYFSLAPGGRL